MSFLRTLRSSAETVVRALRSRRGPRSSERPPAAIFSPGREGVSATVEIDPRRIGPVRMTYSPLTDGDPDPGEIVWTWVPFEENDGRGKDRPVLVVAAERGGTWLAVPLTSKPRTGEAEFVPIGSGRWDSDGRPSWVNVGRVLRVHLDGMRREACALEAGPYRTVEARLRDRYGWT
jgi:hypothetical protein